MAIFKCWSANCGHTEENAQIFSQFYLDEDQAVNMYVADNFNLHDCQDTIEVCTQELDSFGEKCAEASRWRVEIVREPTVRATKVT